MRVHRDMRIYALPNVLRSTEVMSISKQVGRFSISVSDPTPAWTEIRFGNEEDSQVFRSIYPCELYDLQYAISCALRELERMGDQL